MELISFVSVELALKIVIVESDSLSVDVVDEFVLLPLEYVSVSVPDEVFVVIVGHVLEQLVVVCKPVN